MVQSTEAAWLLNFFANAIPFLFVAYSFVLCLLTDPLFRALIVVIAALTHAIHDVLANDPEIAPRWTVQHQWAARSDYLSAGASLMALIARICR